MRLPSERLFLFPNKFKYLGIVFLILGLIASFTRFYLGIKPEFLNVKVFSVYSSFLESKYFTFTNNNIFEEICGILILLGLLFWAFSKEKEETKVILEIRLLSIFQSVFLNIIFLLITQVFVFGLGFIYIMILNLYSTLIFYLIIFYFRLYKQRIYLLHSYLN